MDPIAEMFSQIKNIQNASKSELAVPFSKIKMAILAILKDAGKIKDYQEITTGKLRQIKISLSKSVFSVQRVSRPGRRVYASNGKIPQPKTYKGLVIVSTPEGMMISEEARKKGLGGEVIAEVT